MENSKFYPILHHMVTAAVHFTAFYTALDQAIKDSWKQAEGNDFSNAMARNLQQLSKKLIHLGDEQALLLQQARPDQLQEIKDTLIFHYQWIDAAKSFLVLWRNILFENQKASILFLDKKLTSATQKKLQADSHTSLMAAADHLKTDFHEINLTPEGIDSQLKKWYRQDSPWPVYRQQLLVLEEQKTALQQQFLYLTEVQAVVQNIRQLIIESVHHCQSEITHHKGIAQKSIQYIVDHLNKQTGKIPVFLENKEDELSKDLHNQYFNTLLEKNISSLGDQISVTIAAHAGVLQSRDIDFKRDTTQWLDAEMLPALMEVWEQTINVRNNLKMALINIRNRAILLYNDHKEDQQSIIEKDDLCQPLQSFLQQSTDREKELKELQTLISQRASDYLYLSNLFRDNQSFLRLRNQSALTQLKSNQNELLEGVATYWKKQQKRLNRWLSSVKEEDTLSTSEKIVRYLQSRIPKDSNQSYNGIFLTKGYIGESFWVGRQQELKRIGSIIRQWEKGYRGTVLLTANRFAGKSLFGDLVSNRYFSQSTVRLLPNSTINLKGRSFSTTYNLGEALEFVQKHSIQSKILIWLDDLELWHDPSQPISQNIDHLLQHIDHNFGRIFYLVSLSKQLKKLLDKSHNFQRSFQAEINLNTMSQESIHEAILIRHGATHRQLVTENNEEVSPADFKQMTLRTHRSSSSNIGEALNIWSCSIQSKDEDRVVYHSPPDYILPDFLEVDSALILRILFLEKCSTEYRLRKRFGPAFTSKYADTLLRLQSIGLIKRQLDGWIKINESATNDILSLLIKGGYML